MARKTGKKRRPSEYDRTRADRELKLTRVALAKGILNEILQWEQNGMLKLGRRKYRASLGPKTRERIIDAVRLLSHAVLARS